MVCEMTSIVSLSTPLPKNKNNIPSFSSSPTAIKISDGSPCQIIRKDDICYLIKADNGKEEFVFEEEAFFLRYIINLNWS